MKKTSNAFYKQTYRWYLLGNTRIKPIVHQSKGEQEELVPNQRGASLRFSRYKNPKLQDQRSHETEKAMACCIVVF